MKRTLLGETWYGLWIIVITVTTLIFAGVANFYGWLLARPIILAHALYFSESESRFTDRLSTVIQLASCFLFAFSIFLINSQGTTWGNAYSGIGVVLALLAMNCFWGATRFSKNFRIKWHTSFTGFVGMAYSSWRMYEDHLLRTTSSEADMYWGTDPFSQFIGLGLCLVLIAVSIFTQYNESSFKQRHNYPVSVV